MTGTRRKRAPAGAGRTLLAGWGVIAALGLGAALAVNLGWPMAGVALGLFGAVVAAAVVLTGPGRGSQPWAMLAGAAILAALPVTVALTHTTPLRLLGSARVPVAGLMPRADLAQAATVRWRGRSNRIGPRHQERELRLLVAPVLGPEALVPGAEAPIWAARRAAVDPEALPWTRPTAETLEIVPALAGPARAAAREAAARAGLALPAAPVIVTWEADAAGLLAAQRLRLGGAALACLLLWAGLVAADRRRAPGG